MQEYSKIINSVNFQSISGKTFKELLINYAENKGSELSNADFNNIYTLETFKDEYVKDEAMNRLAKKTIVNSWNYYWLLGFEITGSNDYVSDKEVEKIKRFFSKA